MTAASGAELGPPPSTAPTEPQESVVIQISPQIGPARQGRYAGIVSRSVGMCFDAVVLAVLSIVTLFVVQALVAMFVGEPLGDVVIGPDWGVFIVGFQGLVYFTVAWAVFGRTVGEALVGLRVVRRNGRPVRWLRACGRAWLAALMYLTVIGYLWMLIDNRRRTWLDILFGTVVVYDWRRADEPHAVRDD